MRIDDLGSFIQLVMHALFIRLVEEGYSPTMEFEGGDYYVYTEDDSVSLALVVGRDKGLLGEVAARLEAVPGECGEGYLAEMLADIVVEVVNGSDKDE